MTQRHAKRNLSYLAAVAPDYHRILSPDRILAACRAKRPHPKAVRCPTPADLPLPRAALLRWLVDPSLDLPGDLRIRLLATLLSSPPTWCWARGDAVIEVMAAIRHPGPVFLAVLAADPPCSGSAWS